MFPFSATRFSRVVTQCLGHVSRDQKWSFEYSLTLSPAARVVVTRTQCRDRYGSWQVSLAFLWPKSRRFKCRATFLFFLLLFPSCLERSPAIDTVGSTLLLIKKQKQKHCFSVKQGSKVSAGIYGYSRCFMIQDQPTLPPCKQVLDWLGRE